MLVIGLGNTILGDDGAGIYTVRRLRTLLAADGLIPPVDFAECSAGGLELLELMLGYQQIVIVDAWPCSTPWPCSAVWSCSTAWPSGATRPCSAACPNDGVVPHPGEVRVFDLQALKYTPAAASFHQVGLPGAMELAHRLGLPLPDGVQIWAIAAADIGFREGCTPAVAGAVEATAKRLAQIIPR